MDLPMTIFVAVIAFALAVTLPPAARAYARFRHPRRLRCPLNGRHATMVVDRWHAAVTAFPGPPRMHVEDCSQWPALRDCGEICVAAQRR